MSRITIFRSARARILEATTIARVRIVTRDVLMADEDQGRADVCGYRQSAQVIEVLEGASLNRDFISNEPLDPGSEYIVALRDLGDRTTAPDDDPLLDERDRKFLKCRRKLSMHALGAARMVEFENEMRVEVESSTLIPLELRDTAVSGTVELDAFVRLIRQIREERFGSRK